VTQAAPSGEVPEELDSTHKAGFCLFCLVDTLQVPAYRNPAMVSAVAPVPHDEAPSVGHGHSHGHGKSPAQRLINLLRLEWADVFTLLAFALGVGLLSLVAPAAIEALVNTVAFGILLWPVVVLSMVMFVLLFVSAVLKAMQSYVAECLQRRLFVRTALGFADRLARTGMCSFDHANRADIVNRFFVVSSGQKSIATLLVEGVGILMMTLVGLIVLATYHPYLLTFALVMAGLVAFLIVVLGLGGVRTSIAESYSKFDVAGWLEEIARCPHTFRSGAGATLAIDRADALADHYISTRKRHFSIVWRQTLFALMLEAVGCTILLGLGGWLVINRQLTLGQLVASELIVTLVLTAVSKTGKYAEIFYDLQATLDKLGILDRLPAETADGEVLVSDGGPMSFVADIQGFDGHLQHLEVASGERIALVGATGKTPLLQTLALLRLPTKGRVELDGIDVRELDRPACRQQIAYLGSAEVFEGTISENIRLGRPGVSAAAIREALDAVGLSSRVARLPDGLQTHVAPDGHPLSNSELTRLSVARAIVGKPRMLLIDGSLDGLDLGDCPELLETLFGAATPWTLVIVSVRDEIRSRCGRRVTWS
jgi:ABC-type bacteriocin/lantibiotic exporter with double-glycine peptidase domain